MTTTITNTRHAFLSPGHNSWNFWTSEGSQTITNPGTSHRLLECLSYAIDTMSREGWVVEKVFVEAGNPALVMLTRQELPEG